MEIFKVVLAEKSQGDKTVPVVTATNINFNFQNAGGPITGSANALSNGNFDISADLEMALLNGQMMQSKLPTISRKISELETVIGNMKKDDPEKTKLEAELDIWKTMIDAMQKAIAVALKANYELQNPLK